MNELKCLYYVIHNNNNKPICVYRIDKQKKIKILAGAMPDPDSAYTKSLLSDQPSSYGLSDALAAISQVERQQEHNKAKGNRLTQQDIEAIKQALALSVPYPTLERRYGVTKRTLQRIKSAFEG